VDDDDDDVTLLFDDTQRPLEPLWRGLLVYRALTLLSSVGVVLLTLDEFAVPVGAVAVLVVMAAWTAVTVYGYFPALGTSGPGVSRLERLLGAHDHRGRYAVADLVVTAAVMATTPLVQSPAQIAVDAPVMGSIWTPGAVIALALAFGIRGGLVGAAVVSGMLLVISATFRTELGDIELIVLVGFVVGFASTVLRRSAERLRRAVASEAAARERERLARAVHDGVLQVLGLLRRRGAELGGDAGELGALAGEQEYALRTLLTTGPAPVDRHGDRDLAAALRVLASERVTVSTPAHGVDLPAHTVDELVAVVGEALANVTAHVGPSAPAWVLLESTADGVEISVRDEGPGIPDGRLEAAEGEGRLGVARSMRGRVQDLDGVIVCDSAPHRGTEWIITLPGRVTP
jgi:signal transduction histidine kinase